MIILPLRTIMEKIVSPEKYFEGRDPAKIKGIVELGGKHYVFFEDAIYQVDSRPKKWHHILFRKVKATWQRLRKKFQ